MLIGAVRHRGQQVEEAAKEGAGQGSAAGAALVCCAFPALARPAQGGLGPGPCKDCSMSYRKLVLGVGAEQAAKPVICSFLPSVQGDKNCCGSESPQHGDCSVLAPHPSIKNSPSSASPAFLPCFHDFSAASTQMFVTQSSPRGGSSCREPRSSKQLLPAALCSSCCVHSALPGELQLLDTLPLGAARKKKKRPPSCVPEPFPA